MRAKYTDLSIMPFGKHKGEALVNVPAKWLLWWYDQPRHPNDWPELSEYVKENLPVLKSQAKK